MSTRCVAATAALLHQIPCETLTWRLERNQSVSDGLLHLVGVKEVDTLVCGISGYRWVGGGTATSQP